MTEQLTEEHPAPVVEIGPIPVAWATVPRVNLLPVAIVEGRRFRRTQRMLGGLVLLAVVIAAAGVFLAQRDVMAANDDLTQAQSVVTTRQTEAAKYAAVPAIIAQVDAASTARTQAMSSDALWYRFLNDLEAALPAGVSHDTVGITLTPATGTAAIAANPLTVAGIGTLTITGKGSQYQDISVWLDSLAKITGIISPSLTSATKASDGADTSVTYSISAVLTDAVLSHRYDKEGS